MSESQISKIAAGYVVKGDVISKGGTVFVYDVIEKPTTEDGFTTFTIKEQVKVRPITARWKVPEGQMVNIHNRTPQPAGRKTRRELKRAAADPLVIKGLEKVMEDVPKEKFTMPDEPVIVALDPNDYPDTKR